MTELWFRKDWTNEHSSHDRKLLGAGGQLGSVLLFETLEQGSTERRAGKPPGCFLVAEEKGEVLGYIGMHVVFGEGYMDNLAVFPHARRKGVGKKLVETLIAWLKQHDGLFLTLEVRLSNQAAISLYQSLGFEEAGRRPRFYQEPVEDALLMTLTLRNQ